MPSRAAQFRVLAQAKAAHEARNYLRNVLTKWGVPADDALLCFAEVLSNAITHGRPAHTGRVTVQVRLDETRLRVGVEDHGSRRHVAWKAPDYLEEHGRGLLMVEALSARWGVTPTRHGKEVWFEQDIGSGEALGSCTIAAAAHPMVASSSSELLAAGR